MSESSYQEPWACTIEMRSARGYCPDEVDEHMAELCGFYTYGPTIPEECLAFNEYYYGDAYYGAEVVVTEGPTLPTTGIGIDPWTTLALAVACVVAGARMVMTR